MSKGIRKPDNFENELSYVVERTYEPGSAGLLEQFFLRHSRTLHRELGPASIHSIYVNGILDSRHEQWYRKGVLHREDGPATIDVGYNDDGTIAYETEGWYVDGELHRVDGPAVTSATPEGSAETWYLRGKEDRRGTGPEIVKRSDQFKAAQLAYAEQTGIDVVPPFGLDLGVDSAEWYENGFEHRTDGPASISIGVDGFVLEEYWMQQNKLNREGDLPAVIRYWPGGKVREERWYIDDKLGRVAGPAVIQYDEEGRVISPAPSAAMEMKRAAAPACEP
ncbi:hypothetical protein [Roseovarius sp.]|uniref:hypothetical protein n=1 Tax=Roseovarius sp. TaxID=1486281 RepID=UPI003A977995